MGTFSSVGLIEGISHAIGQTDNEIGGYRITRTSSASSAGATTINAYSTLDWDDAGLIGIDTCVYTYTGKTLTSFTGISHVKNGVVTAGTAKDHAEEAEIADLSKSWSALDLLRRSLLVDYAEGEYLTVVGQNLGLERLSIFKDDDRFREIIKAIAYGPKGTNYGIELALEALVGSGNYEITEDLLRYPNTVFIAISPAGDCAECAQGKAYLTTIGYDGITNSGSGNKDLEARPDEVLSVGSVRLHDLSELFDFRSSIPSAVTYDYYPGVVSPGNAFTYVGTLAEGLSVTANGLFTQMTTSDGTAVYYRMLDTQGARVTPDTDYSLSYIVKVPSTATLGAVREQCSLAIQDGSKEIAVGVTAGAPGQFNLGLYDNAGAGFIGTTLTCAVNIWYEVTLKKVGTNIQFWVDNVLLHEEPYSTWTNSNSNHRIEFGIRATSSLGMRVRTKQLGVTLQTATEYWAFQGTNGSVNTGSPTLLSDTTASAFVSGDVGKRVSIDGSAITNPQGGSNNGWWLISGYISASVVTLIGKEYEESATLAASGRITVDQENAFYYPDDLGKDIVITDSASGNNGTYVITNLIEAGTLTDYADYDTPGVTGFTNICEVASAFTAEADVTWKLQPNFVTESNLNWELSDAGSISGDTLTLRQALWAQDLIMSFLISDVFSGQLLPDTRTRNILTDAGPPVVFEYWPFYLGSTFEEFFDIITAAGVIPELTVGV